MFLNILKLLNETISGLYFQFAYNLLQFNHNYFPMTKKYEYKFIE